MCFGCRCTWQLTAYTQVEFAWKAMMFPLTFSLTNSKQCKYASICLTKVQVRAGTILVQRCLGIFLIYWFVLCVHNWWTYTAEALQENCLVSLTSLCVGSFSTDDPKLMIKITLCTSTEPRCLLHAYSGITLIISKEKNHFIKSVNVLMNARRGKFVTW